MNYVTDKKTDDNIQALQEMFGVYDNPSVIRKAIALATVVKAHRNDDNTVYVGTLVNIDMVKVLLDE